MANVALWLPGPSGHCSINDLQQLFAGGTILGQGGHPLDVWIGVEADPSSGCTRGRYRPRLFFHSLHGWATAVRGAIGRVTPKTGPFPTRAERGRAI